MIDTDQLCALTASELSKLIATREVSPVDVIEAAIERIDAVESKFNNFITITREEAIGEARSAEKAIAAGNYLGPLHGVPFALKDLIATKGVRTTAGSKVLADWVPQEDATLVRRLKAAGAILIGKNNLHEFAAGATNVNIQYGPARNPWDLERITGGSSGGSAGAVAASECTFSIGSDTGGSIREPASLCGVVGLKPTYGRVSRKGGIARSWSLDHLGPLTRSVEDCALVLNAIAGYDPEDPGSANIQVPDFAQALAGGIKDLRVGVPKEYFFDHVDNQVQEAVVGAIKKLEELGAVLDEVAFPSAKNSMAATMVINWAESSAYHEPYIRTRVGEYDPEVGSRLQIGYFIFAVDYIRAQRVRTIISREMQQALGRVDVIVTPTCPVVAPTVNQCTEGPGEGSRNRLDVRNLMPRLTSIFNLTGNPAITVPCGFTAGGLPIGLQIAGRKYDEGTVLRVAHAYQASTPWHSKRPPL
ncbi:MAG: Asp-tRNA(Asn)/Glu-tRNA(Gln) amidotransferase subunit GatA [Chloroflexi bacterium]|nr:Asp-tRNA(Asn)/Glu-tRNA(Gln) amidotransferase subunit GatA [Chloroflexota bacterium]